MAHTARRINFKTPKRDVLETAWESYLWVSKAYFNFTGEHHTFAPAANKDGIILPQQALKDARLRGNYKLSTLKERTSYIMVALNKAIQETKETPNPTPSSPTHTPKINLIITDAIHNRKWIWNFFAIYAARRACDYLIQDRPTSWLNDNSLVIFHRDSTPAITISTDAPPDGLTDIMEHDFTPREQSYSLPPDYYRIGAMMFAPPPAADYATITNDRLTPTKQAKLTKPAKPAKPSGLISLPTLLDDTDIDPKEARQALRKSNTPKPAHGRWEFNPESAPAIKKLIIDTVAKMRKKK